MSIEEFYFQANTGLILGGGLLLIAMALMFIAYRVDKYYSTLEKGNKARLDKKNRVEV